MGQIKSANASGLRVRAAIVAPSGHLLTVYQGGEWSCWPEEVDVFSTVAPEALEQLGIAPEGKAPPAANGMAYYVTDGTTHTPYTSKPERAARKALEGQCLVAFNPDGSLCSFTPADTPKDVIAAVVAEHAKAKPAEAATAALTAKARKART